MVKEKVLETIKKYDLIKSGDSLVVGVSGGPDSICLLAILLDIQKEKDLDFKIYLAHINHMLREEANMDEQYVIEFSKKRGIQYFVKRENVADLAKKEKIGTEEAGRNLRYSFFEEVLKKTNSNKIVTAHNLNDKIETVLMNIIRGSGSYGLKGIEAKRDDKYIRPLIEVEKEEIEKYCDKEGLYPRIDKTNEENIYTRNKIRNELIPFLKEEFNPNILESIHQLSELITEDIEYFEHIVERAYQEIAIQQKEKEIILDLKKFNLLELVIKRKVILYTIKKIFGSTKGIEKVHIEDIIKLCERNIGNKFLIPNKNKKVLVKQGKIFFMRKD